jgi:cell wall-associated NlpC family hydrolase
MRRNYAIGMAGVVLAVAVATKLTWSLSAEELNTDIPCAGATVAIQKYVEENGSEEGLEKYLPKAEKKTAVNTTKNKSTNNKYFSDIAIAKVSGGSEDYVNVRKKPSAKSKRVGKIYNNCGARILKTTKNGWYKIVSGNCTGYIKAEYFVTGDSAQSNALDNGYVFANIKDTGVHVREKTNTTSSIVTNVYHNESYVIKKFSSDGKWVKVKIGDGVSGWVSSDFIKVSVDMDTAITNAEEKAIIKARKEREKAERQAQIEAQQQEEAEEEQQEEQNYNNSNNDGYEEQKTTQATTKQTTQQYGETGGSGASAVVAYAKQFLGNPYVYGGSSLTNGTDCSGFTMSVYAHFGYSLNRSSYTQVYNGREVSLSALQPGDLLFYKYNSSTISHVAMYIGGGQIIHASTEETGIIISGMGSPCAARRIIG